MQVPPLGYAVYQSAGGPGAPVNGTCVDKEGEACNRWAIDGECGRNALYMLQNCARSCGHCHSAASPQLRAGDTADPHAAAPSSDCTTAGTVAGSMRCLLTEHYTESITSVYHTRMVFNNTTNATELVVTTSESRVSTLSGSTVRFGS